MRELVLFINNKNTSVVEVDTSDKTEIETFLSKTDTKTRAFKTELSNLDCLAYIPNAETLILTGGLVSESGLKALYSHSELKQLILDFEETESDEDGIDISAFPNLSYILSRSDLNIKNFDDCSDANFNAVVLNRYRKGHRKVDFAPNYNIYREKRFLFFSTEAKDSAAHLIMRILSPTEKAFSELSRGLSFTDALDSIGIIPVCVPQDMIDNGFGKERKYVSLKNRYADIRLRIDYERFITASQEDRVSICRSTVKKSIDYIAAKDKTFNSELFFEILSAAEKNGGRLCCES